MHVKFFKITLILLINLFIFNVANAEKLKKCDWNNREGIPCIVIKKTPNSSAYSSDSISKQVITKQDIVDMGAQDIKDVLKTIPGLNVFQSGPYGQQTSVFTRGSDSNHTLVLLNGIAINDQSVTDGLFDFGQDFIQTIQQVEVYKGSSGAHFGPNAIAGAVNFITSVDYQNKINISGFDLNNNAIDGNYTLIANNGWHLNFKGAVNQSKTNSVIAKGTEKDGSKNKQVNLNAEKWIKDNLKFKGTLYSRQTVTEYDGSATNEENHFADNRMYALQVGLDRISQNTEDSIIFHYHNYDREYEEAGVIDEYYSEAFTLRAEREVLLTNKLSFGYGGEYKYDWGSFENRGSYTASTKGHVDDSALFGNIGYKFSEDTILSLYGRNDDHKITGKNQTYKINITKIINRLKFGLTHSTGLRNPTLYEFYGSDSYGLGGNTNLNPEKSKTNELSGEYNFLDNINFKMIAYRSSIFDSIESNVAYTEHENRLIDINQEGLETGLNIKGNNQILSLFSTFSKSKKTNGQSQSRRPDIVYGANYNKKILNSLIGPLNLNLNYEFFGKHIDYTGSINEKVKSTDLVNLVISKEILGNNFYFKVSNLFDQDYERPATYSQDGRQITFGFSKLY